MEKEIKLPTIKKATNFKNMQPKVLKSSAHSCSETWTKLINNTMNNSEFPDELKLEKSSKKMIQQNQKTIDL